MWAFINDRPRKKEKRLFARLAEDKKKWEREQSVECKEVENLLRSMTKQHKPPKELCTRVVNLLYRLEAAERNALASDFCYLMPRSCEGVLVLRAVLAAGCQLARHWHTELLSLLGAHASQCPSVECLEHCQAAALDLLPLPGPSQMCTECLPSDVCARFEHVFPLFNALTGMQVNAESNVWLARFLVEHCDISPLDRVWSRCFLSEWNPLLLQRGDLVDVRMVASNNWTTSPILATRIRYGQRELLLHRSTDRICSMRNSRSNHRWVRVLSSRDHLAPAGTHSLLGKNFVDYLKWYVKSSQEASLVFCKNLANAVVDGMQAVMHRGPKQALVTTMGNAVTELPRTLVDMVADFLYPESLWPATAKQFEQFKSDMHAALAEN